MLGVETHWRMWPHCHRKWPHGNEAVAGATLGALARWLHHRYALVKLPSVGHIVSYRYTKISPLYRTGRPPARRQSSTVYEIIWACDNSVSIVRCYMPTTYGVRTCVNLSASSFNRSLLTNCTSVYNELLVIYQSLSRRSAFDLPPYPHLVSRCRYFIPELSVNLPFYCSVFDGNMCVHFLVEKIRLRERITTDGFTDKTRTLRPLFELLELLIGRCLTHSSAPKQHHTQLFDTKKMYRSSDRKN